MLNPVYDIAAESVSSDQWIHCRLILELNSHYLQYAVLMEKKLLHWKYYQLPEASPAEKLGMVEAIFQTNEVLQNNMKEQRIVYNFSKYCLLPEAFFHIDQHRAVLDIMHGNIYKGPVITEKVPGWNLYNIYRLPPGLDELCKARFANASFRHHASLWLTCLNLQENGMAVLFSENEMEVTVLHDQKLLLSQVYACREQADILYHLLNIVAQFQLDRENLLLLVAGMPAHDAALYGELSKYFARMQTAVFPDNYRIPEPFQAVPEHFFSPLLKMSACV